MTDILDLTKLTAPASGDALYIVDDPSGTPSDKYITVSDLKKFGDGGTVTISSGGATLDGNDRRFVIAAESGTYDVLTSFSGMAAGDVFFVKADSGDNIYVSDSVGNINCPNDHDCVLPDDQYTQFMYDGTNYVWIGREISAYDSLDRYVYFDNSMSRDEIQDIINSTDHYIPPGGNLFLQFDDGTYTLDSSLYISGFYGGGTLRVEGNSSDNSLSTSKSVILDFDAQDCHGVYLFENSVFCFVNYLHIKVKTDTADNSAVLGYCNPYLFVNYCYGQGTSTTDGTLFEIQHSLGRWLGNYVSNAERGFMASGSFVYSYNNDETGTDPKYGLYAEGSTIKKYSTQPAGSTANEGTVGGGVIE